jgi:hypothetical protein
MPNTRLARPPSPPEVARYQRVVTFVTQAELEQLQGIAEIRKLALSATVHQLLAKKLKK